jgi:UDP-N-acetyl-D-mannosaminuronic acid dehydrogenase
VNIAFVNELSIICDKQDINVWNLIKLANPHPRVKLLQPGPGVGGHCIGVDPWLIVSAEPDESKLICTAPDVNDQKPHYVIEKFKATANKIDVPKIACLGLTCKAHIDDLRESPAIEIIKRLTRLKISKLYIAEPRKSDLPNSLKEENVFISPAHEAVAAANIVLLLVSHRVFKENSKKAFTGKKIIDTRGLWQ